MLKQGLELNIAQKQTLVLTPQLLQSIRVLGMTGFELEAYIDAELASNPALEAVWDDKATSEPSDGPGDFDREGGPGSADRRTEDFDWPEYLREKGYDDISYGQTLLADGVPERENPEPRLDNYLLEQLTSENLCRISKDISRAYRIVECIIATFDENGFLTQNASEMAATIDVSVDEVLAAIAVLQELEPAGVAASDVRESLVLQYKRAGGTDPLVIEIIQTRLKDMAARSAVAVAKAVGCKRVEAEKAFETIKTLDPKPGSGFQSGSDTQYIIPDFIAEKTENGYEAKMNNYYSPSLIVSPYCHKLLAETEKGSEEYVFLTDRLNAAVAMIKSIEQRRRTITDVMAAIFRRQYEFLEKGYAHLRPMTLKQIADEIGVHESTVSRAIRGKYVQTKRGVVEAKQFFSTGLKTVDGVGVAAKSVKTLIAALINAENKKEPLSDSAIVDLLKKDGICLSRRTVAKYRHETGIQSSAKRAKQ